MTEEINVPKRQRNNKGMTLMEIILVFSLLAVLGTIVVKSLLPVFFGGQISAAKLQMSNIGASGRNSPFSIPSFGPLPHWQASANFTRRKAIQTGLPGQALLAATPRCVLLRPTCSFRP